MKEYDAEEEKEKEGQEMEVVDIKVDAGEEGEGEKIEKEVRFGGESNIVQLQENTQGAKEEKDMEVKSFDIFEEDAALIGMDSLCVTTLPNIFEQLEGSCDVEDVAGNREEKATAIVVGEGRRDAQLQNDVALQVLSNQSNTTYGNFHLNDQTLLQYRKHDLNHYIIVSINSLRQDPPKVGWSGFAQTPGLNHQE